MILFDSSFKLKPYNVIVFEEIRGVVYVFDHCYSQIIKKLQVRIYQASSTSKVEHTLQIILWSLNVLKN